MKDPIQTIETPYEILGLKPGTSKPEIDRAYMAALGRGVTANEAKNARDALVRYPVERAWYDLREYDDQSLRQLAPSPHDDASVLLPARRASTAQAWEDLLKREFPNLGSVHSLAVLWYWWAMYEEQRVLAILEVARKDADMAKTDLSKGALLRCARKAEGIDCDPRKSKNCQVADCPWRDDCLPLIPSTKEMWERVIAYWGMLNANASFWDGFSGIDKTENEKLKDKAVKSLQDELLKLAQRYQDIDGGAALAEQYRSLDLALLTELKSAQLVGKIGLSMRSSKVSCGILMLTHIGMLDMARSAVDEALANNSGAKNLQRLQDMLSPYSSIAVLLDQRRPKAALAAIRQLGAEEKKSKEVQKLHTRALHSLAKEKASLDQMDEALEAWYSALETSHTKEMEDEIRAEIASTCRTKAAAMPSGRRDEAIVLLDKAASLVKDENLRLSLALLLKLRGLETFAKAQTKLKREKQGVTSEILKAFEIGLADLERAEKMGYEGAAKEAETARSVIKQAKSGFLDLSDEAHELFKEANVAAEAKPPDLDKGIECLRKIMKLVGRKTPDEVKKSLAALLNARAVEKSSQVGTMLKNAQEQAFRTEGI